jgi:predicted CxxxxCH...CXXCH cytochrome family protein
VQPILSARCATSQCHVGGSSAQSGLDLSTGVAWAALVGAPATEKAGAQLVVAGDIRRSFLATKLFARGKITKMPLGCGTPDLPCLTDAEIYAILAWIQAGAPAE